MWELGSIGLPPCCSRAWRADLASGSRPAQGSGTLTAVPTACGDAAVVDRQDPAVVPKEALVDHVLDAVHAGHPHNLLDPQGSGFYEHQVGAAKGAILRDNATITLLRPGLRLARAALQRNLEQR